MRSDNTITIHLKNLRFFAYHGLYDLEKENGNEFELDISISFNHPGHEVIKIDDTINYAIVHEMISLEMQQPRELLETFLDHLFVKIKTAFPQVTFITATLYKLTAPIEGLNGKIGVQLERHYSS